jgi:hypothetical protein
LAGNETQTKRNKESTQTKEQGTILILFEVININLATRLEHDKEHTQRTKDIDGRALAYDIQNRWTDYDTCQDKAYNTRHMNLAAQQWNKPYDADN